MESEFGERLRALRTARGETLDAVSKATGLSIAMLSRIERGERVPSPAATESLARHFGLPPDEMIEEAVANQVRGRYGAARAERIGERMQQDVVSFRRMPIEMLGAPRSYEHDRDAPPARVGLESARPVAQRDDDLESETLEAIELAMAAQRNATRTIMRALPEMSAAGREKVVRAFASLGDDANAVLDTLESGLLGPSVAETARHRPERGSR